MVVFLPLGGSFASMCFPTLLLAAGFECDKLSVEVFDDRFSVEVLLDDSGDFIRLVEIGILETRLEGCNSVPGLALFAGAAAQPPRGTWHT